MCESAAQTLEFKRYMILPAPNSQMQKRQVYSVNAQFEIWNGPQAIFACPLNLLYLHSAIQHMERVLGSSTKSLVSVLQTRSSRTVGFKDETKCWKNFKIKLLIFDFIHNLKCAWIKRIGRKLVWMWVYYKSNVWKDKIWATNIFFLVPCMPICVSHLAWWFV